MFQSSPAPRRGRYWPLIANSARLVCFNPRPHQGAGATTVSGSTRQGWLRFQSSPAPRRGRYMPPSGQQFRHRVSILARTKARALLKLSMSWEEKQSFQSSPAPRRGRYATRLTTYDNGEMFQSSPAPRRGRYPVRGEILSGQRCFNPRPHQGAGATRTTQ